MAYCGCHGYATHKAYFVLLREGFCQFAHRMAIGESLLVECPVIQGFMKMKKMANVSVCYPINGPESLRYRKAQYTTK